MSVQKALLISAVPFAVARLQSTVNKTAFLVNGPGNGTYGNTNYTDQDGTLSRKRKRTSLDHLSTVEKIQRRKLLNREAAQNARDRAKNRMSVLKKQLVKLEKEKNQLLMENQSLKENHSVLQSENTSLKLEILVSQCTNNIKIAEESKSVDESSDRCSKGSVEQALFISVPLLKGQDLLMHSFLLVLTLIREVMNASFPFQSNQIPISQNLLMTAYNCPAVLNLLMKVSLLKNCLKNLISLNQ